MQKETLEEYSERDYSLKIFHLEEKYSTLERNLLNVLLTLSGPEMSYGIN